MNKEDIIQKLKLNIEHYAQIMNPAKDSLADSRLELCTKAYVEAISKILDSDYDIVCIEGFYGVLPPDVFKRACCEPLRDDNFIQTLTCRIQCNTENQISAEKLVNIWKGSLRSPQDILVLYIPCIPVEFLEWQGRIETDYFTIFGVVNMSSVISTELEI